MNNTKNTRLSTRKIAIAGIMSAFSILLSLIPSLGYIVVPFTPITITTMHIPVIIAAILEGPVVGGFVGLIFGLSSMYTAATIFSGLPTAFVFLNPLVSVLPRILIGIVAYYVYAGMNKLTRKKEFQQLQEHSGNTQIQLGIEQFITLRSAVRRHRQGIRYSVVVTSLFAFIWQNITQCNIGSCAFGIGFCPQCV